MVNSSQSFVLEVEAQTAKSLADAQADFVITAAQAIIDSLAAPWPDLLISESRLAYDRSHCKQGYSFFQFDDL